MKAWLFGVPGLCMLAASAVQAQETPKIQDKIKQQYEVQCTGREVTALRERIEKMPSGALKSIAADEVNVARDKMQNGDTVSCTLRLRAALNAIEEQGLLIPPKREDGL